MRYSELSDTPYFNGGLRLAVPHSKVLRDYDTLTYEFWAYLDNGSNINRALLGSQAAFVDRSSSSLNMNFRYPGGSTQSENLYVGIIFRNGEIVKLMCLHLCYL